MKQVLRNCDFEVTVNKNFNAVINECAKAKRPLKQELVTSLRIQSLNLTAGAVCVYHSYVETALEALSGSAVPVAAVSTGFPHGLNPLARRIEEIQDSVSVGAHEILQNVTFSTKLMFLIQNDMRL